MYLAVNIQNSFVLQSADQRIKNIVHETPQIFCCSHVLWIMQVFTDNEPNVIPLFCTYTKVCSSSAGLPTQQLTHSHHSTNRMLQTLSWTELFVLTPMIWYPNTNIFFLSQICSLLSNSLKFINRQNHQIIY